MSERTVTEYLPIICNTSEAFEMETARAIKDGYQPYGDPCLVISPKTDKYVQHPIYMQVFVKYMGWTGMGWNFPLPTGSATVSSEESRNQQGKGTHA